MTRLARPAYSRRFPPAVYDSGFFGAELANIQQALVPTGTRLVTADTTVVITDDVILCDCTAGPINVILPDPALVQWQEVTVKKIDASANQVTIVGTVDGLVNPTSHAQFNTVTVMSDGTKWFVTSVGADISTPTGPTTVQRTSNVTNGTTTPGSVGLLVPVTAGNSYQVHYTLFLGNTHSVAQAATLSMTYPGATVMMGAATGVTTGATTLATVFFNGSAGTASLGASWVNFATSPILYLFDIDVVLRGVTGAGNVDLLFASNNTSNTITVGDGSCVIVTEL